MVHKADFARVIWNLADWWVHWTVIKRLKQSQNVDGKSERVKLKIWELKLSVSSIIAWENDYELTDHEIGFMVEELSCERETERFERNVWSYVDMFTENLGFEGVDTVSLQKEVQDVLEDSDVTLVLDGHPLDEMLKRHWVTDSRQFLWDYEMLVNSIPKVDGNLVSREDIDEEMKNLKWF